MSAESLPVTITEEAASRIQEWGLQRELEQMLEYARQTISNTIGFKIETEVKGVWAESMRTVFIRVIRVLPPGARPETIELKWIKWMIAHVPRALPHLIMMSVYATSLEEAA
jgi:hypothetical protein